MVLERLREAGFELELVHELEAFIYFPNEALARRVVPALNEFGYATYPEPTGDGRWVVEAVIRAAPVPEYIAEMRRQLRGLAGPLGGQYDGWSAIPIDEEAEAEAARLAALEPDPVPEEPFVPAEPEPAVAQASEISEPEASEPSGSAETTTSADPIDSADTPTPQES